MKVAALDLGTNTFLCLIAEGDSHGLKKVHQDLSETVRLGQGVHQYRKFHEEALQRADLCLKNFKKAIDFHQVDHVLATATSAARDVSNGEELFNLGKKYHIPIKIIEGEEEARLTFLGACESLKDLSKNILVVDVGGGSTEIILGNQNKILFSKSLNMGGVRLTETFISHQPVNQQEQEHLTMHIQQQLASVIQELSPHKIDVALAVAGTPTALAAIEIGAFIEEKVDGYVFPISKIHQWQEVFAHSSVEEKKEKYKLGGRADIIYAGLSIIHELMKTLKIQQLTVSTKGVRYGLAKEMLKHQTYGQS